MRVLVDIKHPAEVHFFRHLIERLLGRGDQVLVTAHYKPRVAELLDAFGIGHVRLSAAWPTPAGIAAAVALRTARMLPLARRFRPDVMVARVGVEIGAVGRVLGVPAISFDENEYASFQLALSSRLAHHVCTGMGYERPLGAKQVRFRALPQFTYTHPARFQPDLDRLRGNGFDPEEPYVVFRLNDWRAVHDIGRRGASERAALELVRALSEHATVIASRRGGLPPSFKPYVHPVPPDRVLDLLAFARLYIGEGGSMAAEAACLGTPAIWISSIRCGYLNVLTRRYGLVEQISDMEEVRARAIRHLTEPSMREAAQRAHRRLLADSEDPLEFMVEVVDRFALNGR